jgi:hypothetical protein
LFDLRWRESHRLQRRVRPLWTRANAAGFLPSRARNAIYFSANHNSAAADFQAFSDLRQWS